MYIFLRSYGKRKSSIYCRWGGPSEMVRYKGYALHLRVNK